MDISRLTEKVQEALREAQVKALQLGHQHVEVEHLLLAVLEQEQGLATSIFNRAEISGENLRKNLQEELDAHPKIFDGVRPRIIEIWNIRPNLWKKTIAKYGCSLRLVFRPKQKIPIWRV